MMRALGGAALVWMVWLLGASSTLELDAPIDPPVPATVHCDAVLQVGDATTSVDHRGRVARPRWSLDGTTRAVIERRLGDQAREDVVLDEAAISSECDARRAGRTGWAVLLLGLGGALLALSRAPAGATRAATDRSA